MAVGIVVSEVSDQDLRPVIFVDVRTIRRDADAGAERWREGFADVVDLVGRDYEVIALPPTLPLGGPGAAVDAGALLGTLGARISTAAGDEGLLTAGHVAPNTGVPTYDGRDLVGWVEDTSDPLTAGAGQAVADVAVLKKHAGYADAGLVHGVVGDAMIRTDLVAQGAVTSGQKSWVKGISNEWAGEDPAHADWANVYVTRQAISDAGDSGAPVFIDGTNDLAGSVVAGYPSSHTLVQKLQFQLDAFSAKLR
jgi:hypothetical protein